MSVFSNIRLPKVVYETESKYNGKILVIEVGRTKRLSVDGVVQSVNWDSPSVERSYWSSMVRVLKEEVLDLRSIIILGMGGGTLCHLISHAFPNVQITSVEIDPEMVLIARKFFNVDEIPSHRIITDDACRVVASPEEFGIYEGSFGVAVVDIYCGQKYPDLGKSGTFFDGLKTLVSPGGLVIFNRIYWEDHQDDVNSFVEVVENYYHDVKSLIVAGKTNSDNILIYGRA